MTDYTELIRQLKTYEDGYGLYDAAADAIEALNRLVDLNTERCECLREQLRKAQEQYEKHLNELEQQLPKRGEIVRCGECKYWSEVDTSDGLRYGQCDRPHSAIRGNCFIRESWFCADGERKVQDGQ